MEELSGKDVIHVRNMYKVRDTFIIDLLFSYLFCHECCKYGIINYNASMSLLLLYSRPIRVYVITRWEKYFFKKLLLLFNDNCNILLIFHKKFSKLSQKKNLPLVISNCNICWPTSHWVIQYLQNKGATQKRACVYPSWMKLDEEVDRQII